jgi:hypothetical protein
VFEVGEKVQIFAVLDSNDPFRSPTLSVETVQSNITLTLPLPPNDDPIFQHQHLYAKWIDFDPGLTGQWEIVPTDSTGTGPSAFTPAILEPEFLPFVEDVTLRGTTLGARVTWTLPNLNGFDADGLAVGLVEAPSGNEVWRSNFLPLETTSIEPPTDKLQVGVDYAYGIILADLEGEHAENVSKTFTQAFRFTIAGDFNTDGTVDAADYVVWRKSFSGDQAMYGAWRANFGTSLGPGSGSVLPSAEPLSAAVPEVSARALLLVALVGASFFTRRGGAARR